MIKYIELAKRIINDIDKDSMSLLREVNLHTAFAAIHNKGYTQKTVNQIIAFVIYAYDNDSPWLNYKQDRYQNKIKILIGIGYDEKNKIFKGILAGENEDVLEVINQYLIELTNWKWHQIMTQIDYHSKMMRYVSQNTDTGKKKLGKKNKESGEQDLITEDYNIDTISKVNQQKGALMSQALAARKEADELLLSIKKDYVQTDAATSSDFGFEITDEKKMDPILWRGFIKERNARKAMLQ